MEATSGNVCIPQPAWLAINPLDMPAVESEAILSKPFMDAVRAASKRLRGVNKYIQIVSVKDK